MSQETQVTFLTQDAHDRLAAELNELSTVGRTEIAKRIESAREEGDLKENGGYHAAKDEQGKIEARIVQLTQLLRSASVGAAPESHGVVEPGTVITATIAGDESIFLIGNREIAGNSNLSVYSEQSPLGSAILGLKMGESTSYTTPNGKEIAVTVTKVETYLGQ
ncbi:MAG: transcription elongation factor GreA [Microbacteriaceae bacterium]|jgi:transcription elongation factor GreA|nr:transcription elongation factor [Leifsonia sp.]MDQ1579610.1 transcription elongation factor GreA [Microbacteriaceae bacterium]MDQ1588654.1 transcription elongation factor GreA [Microbacteriaceae bacterium]HEV7566762.1 transcription elongation factor GreA [Microbacteriaceae bacterium]